MFFSMIRPFVFANSHTRKNWASTLSQRREDMRTTFLDDYISKRWLKTVLRKTFLGRKIHKSLKEYLCLKGAEEEFTTGNFLK